METPHGLDDPDYAAFAWARYRRVLGWMALVSLGTTILAILVLWHLLGWLNLTIILATGLGIFLTMMMGAALMGLMFLSSGTGHDEQVEDRISPQIEIGD